MSLSFAMSAAPDAKGFVRVERTWKQGDTVRLRFALGTDRARQLIEGRRTVGVAEKTPANAVAS